MNILKAALNDDMYFRPLGFVYPEDKIAVHVEDQLLLGNEIMIAPVYEQNARGRYVYLPEEMKFVKFLPDGTIAEEILEKGVHYVEVALNEIPLFIRKGKCIPVAEAAECVAALDTKICSFSDMKVRSIPYMRTMGSIRITTEKKITVF